jgi:hypothetical protein
MFNTYDSSKPYYNQMGYSEDVLERFWSKVDVKKLEDGTDDLDACMEWTSGKTIDGYPQFWHNNLNERGNRFIYECFNGKIPEDLQVLHSCDNPSCVNPRHLSIGTNQDNVDDMCNKNRNVKGSQVSTSKLIEKDIEEILLNIYNDVYSDINEISKDYDISNTVIYRVLSGKLWKQTVIRVCKNINCDLLTLKEKVCKIDIGNNSSLSVSEILEISELLKTGIKQDKIAQKYNLSSVSTISAIKTGRYWGNITNIKYINSGALKGVDCHTSKLTEDNVKEIRFLIKARTRIVDIAKKFNISKGVIYNIKNNNIWKHVTI